jgi:hypothetical protein
MAGSVDTALQRFAAVPKPAWKLLLHLRFQAINSRVHPAANPPRLSLWLVRFIIERPGKLGAVNADGVQINHGGFPVVRRNPLAWCGLSQSSLTPFVPLLTGLFSSG